MTVQVPNLLCPVMVLRVYLECSSLFRHPTVHGACGMLSGSESQVSGSTQLLHSLWSQTSPLVHLFKNVRLVGLKDGHACLTGHDVGLPDKGGIGPTRLGRKEGGGTSRKAPKRVKGGRPKCPLPPAWQCNPAPQNPQGW